MDWRGRVRCLRVFLRRRRADLGKLLDSNQDLIQSAKRVHPRKPVNFEARFVLKSPNGKFGGHVISPDFKFVGVVEEKASPRPPFEAGIGWAIFRKKSR